MTLKTMMTIMTHVIYVEIMRIGVNMLRKLLIVFLGILAIVSWMTLYMATINYWLGY